jgi:hypothetical protein
MTIIQASKRLQALGFNMKGVGSPHFGQMNPEPFTFGQHHVLTPPWRTVFFAPCNGGWYVTSSIRFEARKYRHRYSYTAQILNIFGGGKTLEEAITEFENNFKTKTYNISKA